LITRLRQLKSSAIDQLIERLLSLLKSSPRGAIFNPWWQVDATNDMGRQAPAIRREQLRAYLSERIGKAQLALIGEALGYRGGHFTGIAMTSERILLGGNSEVAPDDVLSAIKPRRTSRLERASRGFSEPTASIVWSTLLRHGMRGNEFVLWNVFPWHSFASRLGMLSNRRPTDAELAVSAPVLEAFLNLFPGARIVAVGRLAASRLPSAACVRHPASGGSALFRQQIALLLAGAREEAAGQR
jgi:uracil-DNA glycosylase